MHGLTALSKIEESILDERQSDEGEPLDDEDNALLDGDVVVEEFPDVTCSDGFDAGTTSSFKLPESSPACLTPAQKEALVHEQREKLRQRVTSQLLDTFN